MGSAVSKGAALRLFSPMRGWAAPLAEVPDAVFSERLMGDGIAIDPVEGILRAPCDGVIIQAAKHAVTLQARNGAEILMHVGLDTVALNGQGFQSQVSEGQLVATGQTLLEFDLEFLAPRAKSLISPIVITNGDAFSIVSREQDTEVAPGGVVMEISPRDAVESTPMTAAPARREIVVRLPQGIHARPAAMLAGAAKGFAAESFVISQGRRANARSISALMALGVRHGDKIVIEARGEDAGQTMDALVKMLASGLGEHPSPVPVQQNVVESASPVGVIAPGVLRGVRAAPGIALGTAVMLQSGDIAVEESGQGVVHETGRLQRAIAALQGRLEAAA